MSRQAACIGYNSGTRRCGTDDHCHADEKYRKSGEASGKNEVIKWRSGMEK